MKAYLLTTGVVFGLLVLAHLWRVALEGVALAREPWFVFITLIAAALSIWAFVLFRRALGAPAGGGDGASGRTAS